MGVSTISSGVVRLASSAMLRAASSRGALRTFWVWRHSRHTCSCGAVRWPTPKCQFAQVARTDHKPPHLSGSVHPISAYVRGLASFSYVRSCTLMSCPKSMKCCVTAGAMLISRMVTPELLHQVCGIGIGTVSLCQTLTW